VVYRGLRSRTGLALDPNLESPSFLSTTIARDVALGEFTVPSGPGGAVLLEISVRAGTPGVWVPALGDPALAYQGELLLGRGVQLAVRDRRDEDGFAVQNVSNKLSNEPRRMGEDEAGRDNGETRSDLHGHGYTGTTPDRS